MFLYERLFMHSVKQIKLLLCRQSVSPHGCATAVLVFTRHRLEVVIQHSSSSPIQRVGKLSLLSACLDKDVQTQQ